MQVMLLILDNVPIKSTGHYCPALLQMWDLGLSQFAAAGK